MLVPTGSDHKENTLSTWTTTSTTNDSNNYDEPITFDRNNPYNSIATFCTQHQCLNPEEKKTFTAQLLEFFTECGYYDRECLIPIDLQHSFFEVYLLTLLQVIDSPDLEKQRLVALIEKASGMRSDTFPPKYLIFQTRSHPIDVWGWMGGSEGNRIQRLAAPPRVSKLEELDAHAPSRWFDPKQPFDSIQRFTRRCAALNQEDQKRTFGAITHFFRNRAYHGGTLALSDDSARNFAIIDLPFLLEWYAAGDHVLPDNEMLNFKRHQLIACIQQVTQKRFISIEEENQLQQILIEQNPLPQPPSKQGFSWLKSDHLRSSQIPQKLISLSNIESGYTDSDPLKAPFDPLIALALQKFQYPHVFNLDNSSTSCLKSAILLLAWADRWKVTRLKNDIIKWLKEANSQNSERGDQAYISLLGQPEVCSALQNAGIGPFKLKDQGATEETLLQFLRYNMFWNGKGNLIAYSLGEEGKILNDAKLKALVSIQKETLNENMIKEIDQILYNDFNNRFKNLFPKEDKELEFLRKTIFETPTIMRSAENSLDDKELTHYSKNLKDLNLKNLFTFFQNAEVNAYFSIRKAAQTVRKPLEFLFFAQAEAFKASLQATQELSPQEISKMIEQADKLYDSPVKKVVGVFSCVVKNNEAFEALIKLGDKRSVSVMNHHMRFWRLTRQQAERALSLLENKEIGFYLQNNNFDPKKMTLLLKYFINESKIVELCQIFLNFLEENYSNLVAFPLLLEPIVGCMVDFAEGSTEINGILQRQETFLKMLHKMPSLHSKLIDDGTAFIKKKESLYKPPHHLFKPKIHRQALIQIYTKLWLNDLLNSNFKDYNNRDEIEKFVHDSLLRISQEEFNFPSKLTKEDAFKLSNLLVEPSVTEWAKHLPDNNPYCKENLLKLHFALQYYQSKSSSGSGWTNWFMGT